MTKPLNHAREYAHLIAQQAHVWRCTGNRAHLETHLEVETQTTDAYLRVGHRKELPQ